MDTAATVGFDPCLEGSRQGHPPLESAHEVDSFAAMSYWHGDGTKDQSKLGNKWRHIGHKSHPLILELEALEFCDPEEVVETLSKSELKLGILLSDTPQELFPLVLKLISKICLCDVRALESPRRELLAMTCKPKFLEHFSAQLVVFSGSRMAAVGVNLNEILTDMLIFFEAILQMDPFEAMDVLSHHITGCFMCVRELCKSVADFKMELVNRFQALCEELNDPEFGSNPTSRFFKMRVQKVPPPNNFRSLSLYPSQEEILADRRPSLRPNIISGRYSDAEHYLDIQFRLLREDFVRPLREGIAELRETGTITYKDAHIRLYRDVRFMRGSFWEVEENQPNNSQDKLPPDSKIVHGTKVKFPVSNLHDGDWESCSQLMHNSLLCFTKNNFKTVLVATVAKRNCSQLKKGYVLVKFCSDSEENLFDAPYLMIESGVYFEPYFHVMRTIQEMNSFTLPMSQYLVDVSPDNQPPCYSRLPETTQVIRYCLPVQDETVIDLSIHDVSTWPTASQLGLDESQLEALRVALTQELTMIQGPPGTGKTLVGLKIAQILLIEPQKLYRTGPILVVCFTNHALDQFLERILNFTKKIVRVGGQSKSDELETYNVKFRLRYTKTEMKTISPIREQIRRHQRQISDLGAFIDSISGQGASAIAAMSTLETFGVLKKTIKKLIISRGSFCKWLEIRDESDETVVGEDLAFEVSVNDLKNDIIRQSALVQKNPDDQHLLKTIANNKATLGVLRVSLLRTRSVLDKTKMLKWLEQSGNDMWRLTLEQRWTVYWYWANELRKILDHEVRKLQRHQEFLRGRLDNIKRTAELRVMANSDVVGMTTAGGARLHQDLVELKSEVLIVEEAAEVLESHIVSCLTKSCNHLILIGDHHQLRPSTSVYELAHQFNLDVSLFERLAHTRGGCVTLHVQHRMAPEIASLVSPVIYPHLENHCSVAEYPLVKGIPQRLFFFNHKHSETKVEETSSYENEFEAKMAVALTAHLRRQGYSTNQIVIIATYSAQIHCINKLRCQEPLLQGVRVTVVDNFQGEESDVVVLSLVRSNPDNNIGFLSTSNRVCVALSRARHGLYIFGDMTTLCGGNDLWKAINETLLGQDAIGTSLRIRCENHPDSISDITDAAQFELHSPLGGCTIPCPGTLPCTHLCNRPCHIESHETVRCEFPCERQCALGHPCVKKCFEECCCGETTDLFIPLCNHTVKVPCGENPMKMTCNLNCDFVMECGHKCPKWCHASVQLDLHKISKCREPCLRLFKGCNSDHVCNLRCFELCPPCKTLTVQVLPCGHEITTECCIPLVSVRCMEPCTKTLECGHSCLRRCWQRCEPCQETVK